MLSDIDESIEKKHFEIYFQPQINTYNNSIIGAEALVRWNHPEYGRVSPGEFIPLFEKNMMISKLDLFVWEEACIFLNKWKDTYPELSISTNVSALDFYQIDICKELLRLIKKYDLSPQKLKLEITESAFMSDQKIIIEKIKDLQTNGFIIEMDDFGSGYSSFNTLKDIPIDVIKLDMKFLEGDLTNSKTLEILETIVNMAHRLQLPVIAEGVETKEQSALLSEMNCDFNQGYLFARPMPLSDFEVYLKNKKIHSLIDYWTETSQNKEEYALIKELHRSYGNSPVSIMSLKPIYDENNEVIDMKILYCNPAFMNKESIKSDDIVGKSIRSYLPRWDDSWNDELKNVLLNETEKYAYYEKKDHSKLHLTIYSVKKKYIYVMITHL